MRACYSFGLILFCMYYVTANTRIIQNPNGMHTHTHTTPTTQSSLESPTVTIASTGIASRRPLLLRRLLSSLTYFQFQCMMLLERNKMNTYSFNHLLLSVMTHTSRSIKENLILYSTGIESVPRIKIFTVIPLFLTLVKRFHSTIDKNKFLYYSLILFTCWTASLRNTFFSSINIVVSKKSSMLSLLAIASVYAALDIWDLSAASLLNHNDQWEYSSMVNGLGPIISGLIIHRCSRLQLAGTSSNLVPLSGVVSLLGLTLVITSKHQLPFLDTPQSLRIPVKPKAPAADLMTPPAVAQAKSTTPLPKAADMRDEARTKRLPVEQTKPIVARPTPAAHKEESTSDREEAVMVSVSQPPAVSFAAPPPQTVASSVDTAAAVSVHEPQKKEQDTHQVTASSNQMPRVVLREKGTINTEAEARPSFDVERYRQADGTVVLDVLTASLGVETVNGHYIKLLHRHTVIPITRTMVFATTRPRQSTAVIKVYEGDHKQVSLNSLLGQFELLGLSHTSHEYSQIEITFIINAEGVLAITAREYVPFQARAVRRKFVIKKIGSLSRRKVHDLMRAAEPLRIPRRIANRPHMSKRKVDSLVRLAGAGIRFSMRNARTPSPSATIPNGRADGISSKGSSKATAAIDSDTRAPTTPVVQTATTGLFPAFWQLSKAPRAVFWLCTLSFVALELLDTLWKATAKETFVKSAQHLSFTGKYNVLLGLSYMLSQLVQSRGVIKLPLKIFPNELLSIAVLSAPFFRSIAGVKRGRKQVLAALYSGLFFQYTVPTLYKSTFLHRRTAALTAYDLSSLRCILFETIGINQSLLLIASFIRAVIQEGILMNTGSVFRGSSSTAAAFYFILIGMGYLNLFT